MKMGVQAYSSWYVPQRDSEDTNMDPATTFCPNVACPARGQTGQGNIGIHSCKDKRFLCTECHKTFSATKGTAFYRLRTSAETVSLVVTLLAHGCPLQAIVVAFGYDERTVASWAARAVDPTTDRAREALCGPSSPVGLYRWLGVLHPGRSGDLARSRAHGHGWTAPAASVAQCFGRASHQTLRAATGGRDRASHYRWHASTRRDTSTPVARGRRDQYRVHRAAERDVS